MITVAVWRLRSFWGQVSAGSRFGNFLATTLVINLLIAGLNVISGVLAARFLGPDGRGELAAIQTWPTFLSIVAVLGMPDALTFFAAREPERVGRWLSTATCLALLAGLILAPPAWFVLPYLLGTQAPEVIHAARIYLWLIPVYAVILVPCYALRGLNDIAVWNLLRFLPPFAWVTVLLSSAAGFAPDPVSVSQAYLIALALLVIPTAIAVNRRIPARPAPSATLVKPLLSYGLPVMLRHIPMTLNLRFDQMLMVGLLEPKILGLYVVATAWSGAAWPVLNALSLVILPQVAGAESATQQTEIVTRSLRFGVLISLVLAVVTIAITPAAIPLLFGHEYLQAVPAGIVLTLAARVSAFNEVASSGAMGLGLPKLALKAEIVGLSVNAVLLWLMLRRWQLMGAAIASLVSYSVVSALLIWQIRRQTGVSLRDSVLPQMNDLRMIWSRMINAGQLPLERQISLEEGLNGSIKNRENT